MAKKTSLKGFGSKATCAVVATAMGLMLVPAAAFAHYEYRNDSGLAIGDADGDYPDGAWVQTADQEAAGTYIWKDYAHGDNAHYGTYSLYTEMTVKDGVLTGLNLTSAADTFFGKWGTYSPHSNGWLINGWLPDGVNLKVDRSTDEDGNLVLTPVLSGADKYGYSISSMYLESTDGSNLTKAYTQTITTTNRRTGETTTTTSDTDKFNIVSADNAADYGAWDKTAGKLTVRNTLEDGSVNPTNLVNIVYKIGEYAPFNTYIMIDETDEDADKYLDAIEPTDYSDDVTVAGMGLTNRDRWTKTMLTETAQRWLVPWLNGDTEELDAISGATKTATPFDEALNQAAIKGYFTSVAEDIAVSIDAGKSDEQTFDRENYTDQTIVTKNEDGQYVLYADFFRSESDGTHGVKPNKIEVYSIDGTGAAVTQNLQRETPSYEAVASTTSVSSDYEGEDFTWDSENGALTVTNTDINYVRIVYTLGHADSRHAYNLADMVKVGEVKAAIEEMDAMDLASVTAAREAYNALSSDVRGFVTNFAKLLEAEKGFQIASATVAKSSVTYTGKALTPAVTVTAVNGSTIDAANYTVAYSNNTNVGTATVTVTGQGSYAGTATANFTIAKAANTLKLKSASKAFKAKKVKSKKQTVSIKVKTNKSKGKVTYSVAKKVKKAGVSVNAKGKVTVKKGTKKGTYKVTVKSAATKNYKAATATFTVKVK